jgi:pyrroline-5-carboxylate reductase
MTVELVVVGGGRMGEALAAGLLHSGWCRPDALVVVERDASRRDELAAGLASRHRGVVVSDEIPADAGASTGAVLAVKPGDAASACARLRASGVARVLSIAAGVPIPKLEAWLHTGSTPDGAPPGDPSPDADTATGSRAVAVLRAMPNTPALVGAGASAVAPGSAAGPDDVDWATSILAAVGTVVTVPETLLDAVTGLSGSGPAYVFLLAEAMTEAGVLVGLPRATAATLVVQTLLGSARLLAETGDSPESLRAGVTSPGGTTAAGLRALEAAGWRSAVLDAVSAATERARQLGA